MNRFNYTLMLSLLLIASCAPCVSESVRTYPVQPSMMELQDLWEDTPATRDLSYTWRVYRRHPLPNRLHEQLRLYLAGPKDWRRSDQRPAIVFIHGGGWGSGDADQWFPQCRYFALRGLVGVSVQYRLKSETVRVSDCLTDCKSAIRYLRRHAAELGIDPARIIVVGESAGGHLAAALGTVEGFDHCDDDPAVSAVPDTLVLLNPITDLDTPWGQGLGDQAMALSPRHHISQRTPPTLLIHGAADQVVNIQHSRAFHERMIELGRPSRLLVLPRADHAFAVFKYGPDSSVSRTIIEIDRFLANQGYLRGSPCLKEETGE